MADFVFKSRLNYNDKAIRLMSPETRERLYREDKNALFEQMRSAPGAVYAAEHDKLIKKWRV